jgi:prephenate dehydratase
VLRLLPRAQVVPCATTGDAFGLVERRRADAALIPVENSLAGAVAENLDLLLERNLFARAEYRLRISHSLIAARGTKLATVRRVFSHPVALEQCRGLFRRHRRLQAVPFYDTAGAVKHVVEQRLRDAAAIAGTLAARVYGGATLESGIEDDRRNFTRFLLLGRARRVPRGADKTSIAFTLKNVPGALHRALGVFAARGINLSRIESRPVRGSPWEYVFFVDFLRGRDAAAATALRELEGLARSVRVLGVYRAA